MRKLRAFTALLLIICMLLPLAGCGSSGSTYGNYRVLETLATENFAIGFRNDDYVRYYVEAALKELAADSTIYRLAVSWFGNDPTTFTADDKAMDSINGFPQRTLIVGVDKDAFPMSYIGDDGEYTGFDVELARKVCELLGWGVQFISIKAEDAYVELSSGNVDCAWGGLALDTKATNYSVMTPYLACDIVIASRADSGVRSTGKLKGKTVAMDVNEKYLTLLSSDAKLIEKIGQIKRLTGGAQACFDALNSGKADAVIVYSTALWYYGK